MKLTLDFPDVLVETVVRGIMDNHPEAGVTFKCINWKYEALEFVFEDGETGKTYQLNREKLIAAFPKIFTDAWPKGCTKPPASTDPEIWNDWLCQSDAVDFDAFAQLAALGEVPYG